MATFLLILHGLLSVVLIGALTHQTLVVILPTTRKSSMWTRFRAVPGAPYTNSVVMLYVLTTTIGLYIYAAYYRIDVRETLEFLGQRPIVGLFEIKEHIIAIGLGLLPAYWSFWQPGDPDLRLSSRKWTTVLLCGAVWYGFLVGHIVNNTKGFGL